MTCTPRRYCLVLVVLLLRLCSHSSVFRIFIQLRLLGNIWVPCYDDLVYHFHEIVHDVLKLKLPLNCWSHPHETLGNHSRILFRLSVSWLKIHCTIATSTLLNYRKYELLLLPYEITWQLILCHLHSFDIKKAFSLRGPWKICSSITENVFLFSHHRLASLSNAKIILVCIKQPTFFFCFLPLLKFRKLSESFINEKRN